MQLEEIISQINIEIKRKQEKDWLYNLVDQIDEHQRKQTKLPFYIVEAKETGFKVKVNGLFAFIHFKHMPWRYNNNIAWKAIAPHLINKHFYGNVHLVNRNPIGVIINGKVEQFTQPELEIGKEYKGIVLCPLEFGLIIDIGLHMYWKCGSVTGLLHKSEFTKQYNKEEYPPGTKLTTIYLGLNQDGKNKFSNNRARVDWIIKKPRELVGEVTWARVIRKTNSSAIELIVQDRYKGVLKTDSVYAPKYAKILAKLKKELTNEQIINCEVIDVDEELEILTVKWLAEIDTDLKLDNSVANMVDKNTISSLIEAKKMMFG